MPRAHRDDLRDGRTNKGRRVAVFGIHSDRERRRHFECPVRTLLCHERASSVRRGEPAHEVSANQILRNEYRATIACFAVVAFFRNATSSEMPESASK